MSRTPLYIDIHVLQTIPPSCVNRDDNGSPKTARFGGVRRARVSSQAWKKAMRDEFAELLDDESIGQRTKYVVDLVAEHVREMEPSLDEADARAKAAAAVSATGIKVKDGASGYLLFIAPRQAHELARLALEAGEEKIDAKKAKAVLNPRERPTLNAADIALFGRMVADAAELNVDASVQVAHAIGVSPAEVEFDYYTAMDDRSPEDQAGAGMIGTVEFLSSTLYRYATVDVYHLAENLGTITAAKEAITAFLMAFARSMPTGKQNAFANRTLPSGIVIQLRDTQPVSLVNAFERPVRFTESRSILEMAASRMVAYERSVEDAFGVAPLKTYVVSGAPDAEGLKELDSENAGSFADVVSSVGDQVSAYLGGLGFVDEGRE